MGTTVAKREYIRVLGGALTRIDRAGERPFDLRPEPSDVGRAAGCALVVEDSIVSSAHFEVHATARGVRLRDLASRNRTFIHGDERIDCYLRQPARIQRGETILQLLPAAPVAIEAGTSDVCGAPCGSTPHMQSLFHRIRRVAQIDIAVLVAGEIGTGKELVAHAIHATSPRARRRFVVFDCCAVTPSLVESALYGHVRGAFTGADREWVATHPHGRTARAEERPRICVALGRRAVARISQKSTSSTVKLDPSNRNLAGQLRNSPRGERRRAQGMGLAGCQRRVVCASANPIVRRLSRCSPSAGAVASAKPRLRSSVGVVGRGWRRADMATKEREPRERTRETSRVAAAPLRRRHRRGSPNGALFATRARSRHGADRRSFAMFLDAKAAS